MFNLTGEKKSNISNEVEEESKTMSLVKKLKTVSPPSVQKSDGIGPLEDIDFTRKSFWMDLQLTVEGKDLYVPKSHLALISPVFRLMFQSEFKEKDLSVLPLPGKKYEDVLTFLKCTHPGARVKVTYNVVPNVLPLAHEYQVKWLLDDCTDVMLNEMDASKHSYAYSSEIVRYCSMCVMAERYSLNSVKNAFISRMSSMCYKVYKDLTEFKQVSTEVRHSIVCARLSSIDNK